MDEKLLGELKKVVRGDFHNDQRTLIKYQSDGSMFKITPKIVILPKDIDDIKSVVKLVAKHKPSDRFLAITTRTKEICLSGAEVGASILLDISKIDPTPPMMSNAYVDTPENLQVVLANGEEYTITPLNRKQLECKCTQNNYEGYIYQNLFNLLDKNYDIIRNSRPKVIINSMGYNIWDVWNRESGVFDLTKLFIGAQNTLCVVVRQVNQNNLKDSINASILVNLGSQKGLQDVLSVINRFNPTSVVGFDRISYRQSTNQLLHLIKQLGTKEYLRQQLKTIKGFSGLVLKVTLERDCQNILEDHIERLVTALRSLKKAHLNIDIPTINQPKNQLNLRPSLINLLENLAKDGPVVPFLDDLSVHPSKLERFLVDFRKIISQFNLPIIIYGDFKNGNLHTLSLLDIDSPQYLARFEKAMPRFVQLIKQYNGVLSGTHGDGLVRSPWIKTIYGQEIFDIFRQVKEIFDPQYILNPHIKTDASWEYTLSHIKDK